MSASFRPASVLVYVKEDVIGDGIIKLPFVKALRDTFPEARIAWLAGPGPSVYATTLKPVVSSLLDEVLDHTGIAVGRLAR